MPARTRLGPPVTGPAQELIDSGFTLENADAPLLHEAEGTNVVWNERWTWGEVDAEFETLGYNVAGHGQKAFNGVAILSKLPFDEVTPRLPGDCPVFSASECRYAT